MQCVFRAQVETEKKTDSRLQVLACNVIDYEVSSCVSVDELRNNHATVGRGGHDGRSIAHVRKREMQDTILQDRRLQQDGLCLWHQYVLHLSQGAPPARLSHSYLSAYFSL
jgi:hypothetical protein